MKDNYQYLAHITWEWGSEESKAFDTIEERDKFLDKNEECIEKVIIQYGRLNFKHEYKTGNFYCPTRDWSDYEMDMYL